MSVNKKPVLLQDRTEVTEIPICVLNLIHLKSKYRKECKCIKFYQFCLGFVIQYLKVRIGIDCPQDSEYGQDN